MKQGLIAFVFVSIWLCISGLNVPYSQEPLHTEANLLTGLSRVSPEDKAAEKLSTHVWFWQDNDNLCFTFQAVIDSTFTPGPVSTRDVSNKADYLRIQLITIPDAYFSYLFNFYATGNLLDAVREVGRADVGFNTNYTYTSTYNDTLWIVEGKIPLCELRFKQDLPYKWKVIITRHHDKTLEEFSLPWVIPKMQNSYFVNALDIQLSHPVKRKLDLTVKPYIVKSYDLVNNTDSFDPDNIGLDIALNPAQRTRIKLSINPDFSDVPPDTAADIYNSKYPRFYTENRFFFTEDIDAFGVPVNAFYSRRIVKPSLTFKATGNSKYINWGILGALDKQIVDSGITINRDDYFQVLSIIPKTKTLKLANAIVSRVNKDYYSHVFSGTYRWDVYQDVTLSSWNAFSVKEDDRNSDTLPSYGSANNASLTLSPGNWSLLANGTAVSKNMTADAGYQNDSYYHKLGSSLSWDSDESSEFINYQGFSVNYEYYKYYSKRNNENYSDANYYINFRPRYGMSLSGSYNSELDILNKPHNTLSATVTGTLFRWQPLSAQFQYTYKQELVYNLLDVYSSTNYYGNLWGFISQVWGYDISGTLVDYSYPNGVLADYGGLLPYATKLDDNYAIINAELNFTPNQRLRFACGSGLSTYETEGFFNDLNLFGNLRYEFKSNCFFYAGFNTNQLQDQKSTYSKPHGHYLVNTSTAYAKLSITL
ncbi:MAG: hypothetical protein PHO32_00740 [Candidatus Cloacimonetes bacterium]|nr:hypothetical protein [Candidatus Cloacimonadota bacterium]